MCVTDISHRTHFVSRILILVGHILLILFFFLCCDHIVFSRLVFLRCNLFTAILRCELQTFSVLAFWFHILTMTLHVFDEDMHVNLLNISFFYGRIFIMFYSSCRNVSVIVENCSLWRDVLVSSCTKNHYMGRAWTQFSPLSFTIINRFDDITHSIWRICKSCRCLMCVYRFVCILILNHFHLSAYS